MSEPIVIVGLVGQARTGKDSVAKLLQAHFGFQRVALADGVREALNSFDVPSWDFRKERDIFRMTDRTAMQTMGTEVRNAIGTPYLWAYLAMAKVCYAHRFHPVPRHLFVVPDVRYPHEPEVVRAVLRWNLGGRLRLWKIRRPGAEVVAKSAHSSERELDQIECNRELVNDGDLDDLAFQVLNAWDEDAALIAQEGPNEPIAPEFASVADEEN